MIFTEAIVALAVAASLYVAFSHLLARMWWPVAMNWIPLLVLFLFVWAGGVWVTPFGPEAGGIYWLPYVVVGLLAALVLAAATPPWWRPKAGTDPRAAPNTSQEELAERKRADWLLGLCVALLAVAIVVRHLR